MKECDREFQKLGIGRIPSNNHSVWIAAWDARGKQDKKICFDLMESHKMDFAEGCRCCGNKIEEQL